MSLLSDLAALRARAEAAKRKKALLDAVSPDLILAALDKIDHLYAALRDPTKPSRVVRLIGTWTPEARAMLLKELQRRYGG